MGINRDKPDLWKTDIAQSVDMYNEWFLAFAPKAFRETRVKTTDEVAKALADTQHLRNIQPADFRKNPTILPTLRMSTCPPLAVDRLIGLSGAEESLVKNLEKHGRLPPRMTPAKTDAELAKLAKTIERMADPDIFVWLTQKREPTKVEADRAATIVADRLCGSVANPIIRNAQEARQLALLERWLTARHYNQLAADADPDFRKMPPGTFTFRMNVPVAQGSKKVNIPVDAIIMPLKAKRGQLPILIEAKSAGDFTNTNKRRKEEATKMRQLGEAYGARGKVPFLLLLCGYFGSDYLGYEAAEGIDWIWEHRISDLEKLGL